MQIYACIHLPRDLLGGRGGRGLFEIFSVAEKFFLLLGKCVERFKKKAI